MKENKYNEHKEAEQQEQGIATEQTISSSEQEESLFYTSSPASQDGAPSQQKDVLEAVVDPWNSKGKISSTEETGMNKPKDFSPVPPPPVADGNHSIIPPSTSYSWEGSSPQQEPENWEELEAWAEEVNPSKSPVVEPEELGNTRAGTGEPTVEPAGQEPSRAIPYYPGYQRQEQVQEQVREQVQEQVREQVQEQVRQQTGPEAQVPHYEQGYQVAQPYGDPQQLKNRQTLGGPTEGQAYQPPQPQQQPYPRPRPISGSGYNPRVSVHWPQQIPPAQQPGQYPQGAAQQQAGTQGQYPQGAAQQQAGTQAYLPYGYPGQPQPYQWDYASYEALKQAPKKKKRGMVVFFVAVGLAISVFAGGAALVNYYGDDGIITGQGLGEGAGENLELNITETPDRSQIELPPAGELLETPQVAKKVGPSVVGVLKYSDNNLLEPTGLGSGIVMSTNEAGDIFIISNAHVVEFGTNYSVRMHDGKEFDASLVGADARSDLAVLRVSGAKVGDYEVVPAELGTSENMQVGDSVVAIGNPVNFELSGSVTQGIVSALNREIQTDTSSMIYIQTDAAINPGNSGGALANVYGQVIGINTLKVNAVGFEGIGFAIPISNAIPVLKELVEHGTVTSRAMLGIMAYPVQENGTGTTYTPSGLKIEGASDNAITEPELLQHDIITHCNDERVYSTSDLHKITDKLTVGDTVELTVFRKVDTVETDTITVVVELIASADFDQNLE